MQLHPALSFCSVQDRHVFLDLAGDRYFCLNGELEASWKACLAGTASPGEADRLAARGLVVPGEGPRLEPCPKRQAEESLLDGAAPAASIARVLALAWIQAATRRKLRRSGIGSFAAALAAARRGAARTGQRSALAAIACDFERLGLLTGTHNLCLPRSLALGLYLARRGYAASVVLGVRLGPFRAHCWTECDGLLVNDRFERVRHYTAIRRL